MEILTGLGKNRRAVIMATHNYNLVKKFPARIFKCENENLTETSLEDPEIRFLTQQIES